MRNTTEPSPNFLKGSRLCFWRAKLGRAFGKVFDALVPKKLRKFAAPALAAIGAIVLPGIGAALGAKLGALIGGAAAKLGAAAGTKLAMARGTAAFIGGKGGVAALGKQAGYAGARTLAGTAASQRSVGWATTLGGVSAPSATGFTTAAYQQALAARSPYAPYAADLGGGLGRFDGSGQFQAAGFSGPLQNGGWAGTGAGSHLASGLGLSGPVA